MTAREDWLESRRLGLGGSDIAAILGASPWAGAFDVWISKVTPAAELGDNDDKAKRRGRLLERAVGDYMADELERTLTPGTLIVHPEYEWARGTPDFYLDADADDLDRDGAECKTARSLADWVDGIPLHYRLQCLWYLAISPEIPRWHLGVYGTIADDWRIYTIDRADNADIIEELLRRGGVWWRRHVVDGVPPEIDTSRAASRWLRSRHGDPRDIFDQATDADEMLVEAYRKAVDMERAGKMGRELFSAQLQARIGDDAGLVGAFGRIKWSRWTQTSLDMKRVRAELPLVIEGLEAGGYQRSSERGRLTITPTKEKKK